MAISDFAAYQDMKKNSDNMIRMARSMRSFTAGRLGNLFTAAPFGAANPTVATALSSTSPGAEPYWKNGGANPLRLVQMNFGYYLNATIILADRLSHQGGLSAIVTTPQTTNLPTAALTRYTDGVGVWAGIQIYATLGTTATTFTVSYTNSDGVAGRTSIATNIGSSAFNVLGIVLPIPLQEGDKGVRSVESVTLAATTGTAGSFGVVLYKPLIMMPVTQQGAQIEMLDPLFNAGCTLPELVDGTCLDVFVLSGATGSAGALTANMRFAEDR
jgi:hypothetical protein